MTPKHKPKKPTYAELAKAVKDAASELGGYIVCRKKCDRCNVLRTARRLGWRPSK